MSVSPDVIVRETLTAFETGKKNFSITIVVERPVPWDVGGAGEYACWITIDPLLRRRAIHGLGPLQALALALRTVKWELELFQEEGGVIENIDLYATLPFKSLEDIGK